MRSTWKLLAEANKQVTISRNCNIIKIAIHGWELGILNDDIKLNNGKLLGF
jgi:hypothetical protein